MTSLPERTDYSEKEKESLRDGYRFLQSLYEQVKLEKKKQGLFSKKLSQVPERIDELRNKTAELEAENFSPTAFVEPDVKRTELERNLKRAQEEIEDAEEQVQHLSSEYTLNEQRRLQIIKTLEEIERQQVNLREKQRTFKGAGALGEVQQWTHALEKKLLELREQALKAEQRLLDGGDELTPLQLDYAHAQLEWQKRKAAALRLKLNAYDVQETQDVLGEYAQALIGEFERNPELLALVQELRTLLVLKVQPESSLKGSIEAAESRETVLISELQRLSEDGEEIRRRYRIVGPQIGMGRLLRSFRDELPVLAELYVEESELKDEFLERQLTLFSLEERREVLAKPREEARRLIQRVERRGGERPARELREAVRKLCDSREELLNELLADFRNYVNILSSSLQAIQQLTSLVEDVRSYIEERVLWIPVSQQALLPSFEEIHQSLGWFFDSTLWWKTASSVFRSLRFRILPIGGGILLLFVLRLILKPLKRKEVEISKKLARISTDSFFYTIQCLCMSLVRALWIPGAVWFLGYIIAVPDSEIGSVLGQAMQNSFFLIYSYLIVYEIVQPGGLGVVHFRWPETVCQQGRKAISIFLPFAFTLLSFLEILELRGDSSAFDSVGRIVLALWIAGYAYFIRTVIGPKSELGKQLLASPSQDIEVRSYPVWNLVLVVVPVLFALLCLVGFQYASEAFIVAYRDALAFLFVIAILRAMLQRFIAVVRRRALLAERISRLEKTKADEGVDRGVQLDNFENEARNAATLDSQTRSLITSGLGVLVLFGLLSIFADVVPAFQILSRIQIWPKIQVVELEQISRDTPPSPPEEADAEISTPTLPQAQLLKSVQTETPLPVVNSTITLFDVFFAVVVLFGLYILTTYLPTLIEIAVVQRIGLEPGAKYAAATLVRYGIGIVGLLGASHVLGLQWKSVQWLAAALTFGLAFGLQEIFANFISGIIVLFEQPMRVGDVVTIRNTTGTVSKIRMRATTITDWNRKELILPNKEFVTGELVNWTLSEQTLRVDVAVGIAYGSDTALATRVLYDIAAKNRRILKDPPPFVYFRDFGSSSLDFEIWAFVGKFEDRLLVQNYLRTEIDAEFKKHGIEIAFPQRDIHVRGPIEVHQASRKDVGKAIENS